MAQSKPVRDGEANIEPFSTGLRRPKYNRIVLIQVTFDDLKKFIGCSFCEIWQVVIVREQLLKCQRRQELCGSV